MKNTWEECGRDDLNMIPKMQAAGWVPIFDYKDVRAERLSPENPPMEPVAFNKGRTRVWKNYDFGTGNGYWQTADIDLSDNHFVDHRRRTTLEEVLKKEGGRP
jgi:hypothetical protein